jgi:uracil-DNA glycosylase
MKTEKKIETHKIGLVGQAPSRRGDPRKPLAGPNGQKIARLAGISHDELIGCRRMHLNTRYRGKRRKGDAFNRAEGNANAGDVLLDWRVERIVLLGKNVARCFGLRDVPFLAEIRIYGRRFLILPHPSGTNRWWNERRNERRARQVLQRFLRGETVLGRGGRQVRPARLDEQAAQIRRVSAQVKVTKASPRLVSNNG